jgi:UDP-2,4-diacetamido-2,4,6-trideoxy-beta-L-altropyranose hydrolase
MRCLSLAEALASRGVEVHFFSRHVTEQLCSVVSARGYHLKRLARPPAAVADDLPHSSWLGTSQTADADEFVDLACAAFDWVVVDHYSLDARWEAAVRSCAAAVLAIDDVADRHHDCDLLVDQNLYSDPEARYRTRVAAHCRLLLGPTYALLRPEFTTLRRSIAPRDGRVRNVLVTLGGTDARNLTLMTIRALHSVGMQGRRVDVIIGAAHAARSTIEEACRVGGFHCHVQPSGIARLMAEADLAIGAAGSTSWERCCLGVPAICITDGENQIAIADGLAAAGAVVNLGDGSAVGEDALARQLAALLSDRERLGSLSRAAYALVDGLGTRRVCSTMGVA